MIQEVKKAVEDGTLKAHHAPTCPRYLKGLYFTTQNECRCSVLPAEQAVGIEESILWIDGNGRRYIHEELTLEHLSHIIRKLSGWMRDTSASRDMIKSYRRRLDQISEIRWHKLADQEKAERAEQERCQRLADQAAASVFRAAAGLPVHDCFGGGCACVCRCCNGVSA